MKSIAFIIGTVLRVVELEMDVNKNVTNVKEILVVLKEENGYLNLFDRFQKIMTTLQDTIRGVQSLVLLVLPAAGFTDTRVVYLWLQAEKEFNNLPVDMYKIPSETELETNENFTQIFVNTKPSDVLEYAREPSIGKK